MLGQMRVGHPLNILSGTYLDPKIQDMLSAPQPSADLSVYKV